MRYSASRQTKTLTGSRRSLRSIMMIDLKGLLTTDTKLLWAALVSALVSAATSYASNRWLTRDKLRAEYEHEQRRRLRELIGRYHGRLLQAAVSLNHRLWNLYANHSQGWLHARKPYSTLGYYLLSTVHRFLALCTFCRRLEGEALYLDARIAVQDDFDFLRFSSAILWVMTDIEVFEGVEYDKSEATDHFFSDNLRRYCDSCVAAEAFISLEALEQRVVSDRGLDDVIHFFVGLSRDEKRLRWDRIVALHLVTVAFIDTFGYPEQRSTDAQWRQIALHLRHREVLSNLLVGLARLGLKDHPQIRRLSRIEKRLPHVPPRSKAAIGVG